MTQQQGIMDRPQPAPVHGPAGGPGRGNGEDARESLRQRLQQQAQQARQVQPARPQGQGGGVAAAAESVAAWLRQLQPELQRALPRGLSADRLVRIALTVIRLNPELLKCSKASLAAALLQSAQLGLEPGPLGHVYLVPFWNSKTRQYEVTFVIGYRGMLELAYRSDRISSIYANVVRERDRFDFAYGLNPRLEHVPALHDPGEVVGAYMVARLKTGDAIMHWLSREDIERHRSYSRAAETGPWVEHYGDMARKTVIRDAFPYLPVSVEAQRAVLLDEASTEGGRIVSPFGEVVAAPLEGEPLNGGGLNGEGDAGARGRDGLPRPPLPGG